VGNLKDRATEYLGRIFHNQQSLHREKLSQSVYLAQKTANFDKISDNEYYEHGQRQAACDILFHEDNSAQMD
jgi:hypothetical protein